MIELLIVVAIIAILAAIAVPNFLAAQVRAKVSRAKKEMQTLATENPKHRRLQSTATPFRGLPFLFRSSVLPLTTKIRFIDFNRTTKDFRNILQHRRSYTVQRTQNPLSVEPGFLSDGLSTQTMQKPMQQFYPFTPTQLQRQLLRIPFILALSTTPLAAPDYIQFLTQTTRTIFGRFHVTTIS